MTLVEALATAMGGINLLLAVYVLLNRAREKHSDFRLDLLGRVADDLAGRVTHMERHLMSLNRDFGAASSKIDGLGDLLTAGVAQLQQEIENTRILVARRNRAEPVKGPRAAEASA